MWGAVPSTHSAIARTLPIHARRRRRADTTTKQTSPHLASPRKRRAEWLPVLLLVLAWPSAAVHAQPQSVTIPLQYVYTSSGYKLGISVGINAGAPQPYVFDTGSSVFNAAFNPATWNGFGQTVPNATVPNGAGVHYCYGSGVCFTGNLVQVPTLSFYAPGATAGSPAAASLSASPGYQINADFLSTVPGQPDQHFPSYFQSSSTPPHLGAFYGVFGAGNFATLVGTGATVGGVLGQTIIPGVTQGYVVSANGQPNPASFFSQPPGPNGPTGTQTVTIAGRQQAVSPCTVCVTVGLTPQVIGQFAPVGPPTGGNPPGLVPWAVPGRAFPNPYGGATGNNGSTEFGSNFTVRLTSPGGASVSGTNPALLDSGTASLKFGSALTGGSTAPGTTVTLAGATASNAAIVGLPTFTATLADGPTPTYQGQVDTRLEGVAGIAFFMQNSVMFDLSDSVTGYTPFYVTTASLATTADGPLIIDATNVPLGLAGAISGPGGVTINSGGAAQLSATNTYTGVTTIAGASGGMPAGLLLISGPGSIASSAGVVNNGIFDISRAWSPISIQSLSGSGQVNLGGQNLTITNASGTFSGTIGDGGAFPVGGGSLTLAGGQFTLAGTGSFTGGTVVSGGSFILTGSLSGDLGVLPAGSFTVASGGSYANPGGVVVNMGTTTVNGAMTASVLNAGTLGGTGTIMGNVLNAGTVAPGNSIGTLSIAGNYMQAASGTYSVEVNGAGQSDLINVGGAARLQGGSVSVFAQPGSNFAPRTTYRILNAAGGLSGTFASVNELYPFLLSSLSYDANNVYLTLQIGGFAAAAQTPTQYAVGATLDAAAPNATGDFATVLGSLATLGTGQVLPFLTGISGQNYSGFSNTMVQGAQLFMNNFATQSGGGTGSRVALAEACDVVCDTTSPALWGAWGGALGGLGTVGAGLSTGAVTYNLGGFAAGLDRQMTPNLRAGVTVGYMTGTQWIGGFSGQGFSNTVQAGLYGNYSQGKAYLDGFASYAYSANQMSRAIAIPNLPTRTAQGQTGANQAFGQLEGGYRFELGGPVDVFVTPFARLQGYTGTQNAFNEFGAQSLSLSVAAQTTSSLRSVLGAQFGGGVDVGWREKLMAQFRLGWSHEYADTTRPVSAVLAGAPTVPFTTYGASLQRDGVVVGVAANTAVAEGTSLYLRYEGNISGLDSAHAITAGMRMTW